MWSSDPADLFCQLYDAIDDHAIAADRRWEHNAHLRALMAEIEADALDGHVDAGWLESRLSDVVHRSGEDEQAARWAAARGLDKALAHSNPMMAAPRTGSIARLTQDVGRRYATTGRFDRGREIEGALLPKLAVAERTGETTASRGQAFSAVHRVPADAWNSVDVDFAPVESKGGVLPRASRNGAQGLVVACVPMLESLEEVELKPVDSDGGSFFTADPCMPSDVVEERVRVVLDRLDNSGAMLAVAPELALSETVLATWKRAVLTHPQPLESALQWVFVGTGALRGEVPPCNCGVLLDRASGREVLRQEKLYPFTLKPEQLTEWGLSRLFPGAHQVEERMTPGKKLLIRESPWGRVAVLICEDLTKVLEDRVGRLIRSFGVSLLIAPVFSKEVRQYYWEHQQAKTYGQQAGAPTVVANSLVIPRAAGQRGDVGTCLVNAPGGDFHVGKSRRADQISVFWLTANSVEVPATHPVAIDPA